MSVTSLFALVRSTVRVQVRRAFHAIRDPWFYVVASLGLAAWFTPLPRIQMDWDWLLVKALYEEFLFRFLLQEALDRVFGRRFHFGPCSLANVLASLAFCAMHLFTQSTMWAALIFFPSLLFGWAWDRYKSVLPPAAIHFFYNYCHFYRLGLKKYIPLLPNLF
ncbi:MAG: JDVT-CTERM system glutamic-type intramembrane protease [Desulfovibrionaceae bacterium]